MHRLTGPIGDGGFAYRLGGFYEEQDSFRNNAGEESAILTGQIAWQLAPETELVASFEHYDVDLDGNRLRGVAIEAERAALPWLHRCLAGQLPNPHHFRRPWCGGGGGGGDEAVGRM